MTPRSFLEFIAEARGISPGARRQRLDEVFELLHLERVLDQTIDTLSKGYRRRVGLAQAILHDPEVLILDEPTDGLDPNQKHEVRELIGRMAKSQDHRDLDAPARRGRGRLQPRDHHRARQDPRRRHAARPRGALAVLQRRVAEAREPGARFRAARNALKLLPEVASTELDEKSGRITAFPAPGKLPLASINALAERQRWPLAELHLESGRLDEVFRSITGGASGMSGVAAVFKRELASYFATPIAYVFIVIFLVARRAGSRSSTAASTSAARPTSRRSSTCTRGSTCSSCRRLSMRLWAEERKSGSIELLMTLPIETWQAVAGKFLAAWAFTGIALALTFPIWITVNYLGDPDNGVIVAAYVGSFLMAGGFLAIGACISAATKNQVIAFILSGRRVLRACSLRGSASCCDVLSGWRRSGSSTASRASGSSRTSTTSARASSTCATSSTSRC